MKEAIALPDLAACLQREGVEIKYAKLYSMVCSGEIPGAVRVRGRWRIKAPISEVAEAIRQAA